MTISARSILFSNDTMGVALADGRTPGVPLAWFPRLLAATPEQRMRYEISVSSRGLHWEEPEEDVSVDGPPHGRGDQKFGRSEVA